jgi:hypothetical protein
MPPPVYFGASIASVDLILQLPARTTPGLEEDVIAIGENRRPRGVDLYPSDDDNN